MSNSISSYSQLKQQILGYDDEEPDPQDEEVVYEQSYDCSAEQIENSKYPEEDENNPNSEFLDSNNKGPKRKVVLAAPKRDGRGRPPGSINARPGRKRGRKPMVKELPVRRGRRGRPSLYKTVKDLPLIYGSRFSSVDGLTKLLIEYQQIAQIRMNLNESIRLSDTMEYVERDVLMSLGFSFLSFGCDSKITHCDSDSVEPCPFKLEVVMSQDSRSLFVRLFHDVHCQKVNVNSDSSPMVEPNDFAELKEKMTEFGKSYFSRETLQRMNDLRLDGVVCDMIFTSKNGGFLKGHRMVAVSRSPVLAQMLLDDEDENDEGSDNKETIEPVQSPAEFKSVRVDCSFETLEDFLNVLYETPISSYHNRNELCSVLLSFEIEASGALKERGHYDSEEEYDPYSAEAYMSDSDAYESSPSPKRRRRTPYGPRVRRSQPIYDDFEDSDASLPMDYNSDFDSQMAQILESSTSEQKKLLVCDICIKPFNDLMSLESHRIIAHKSASTRPNAERPNIDFFNSSVQQKPDMNFPMQFIKSSKGPNMFDCGEFGCDYSAHSKVNVQRHMSSQHGYGDSQCQFACNYCEARFVAQRYLWEHQSHNHGQEAEEEHRIRCTAQYCGYSTYLVSTMVCHFQEEHPQLYQTRCHICNQEVFVRQLSKHYVEYHDYKMNIDDDNCDSFTGMVPDEMDPSRLRCSQCSQTFSESSLAHHQHNCSMLYKRSQDCSNCPFKSPSRRILAEHMLRNHGIPLNDREWGTQILRCQEHDCDFTTLHSRQIKKHAEKNHMSRKHLCTVCGKLYATLDTLRVHYYYAHKPCSVLKCKVCGKVFRTKQVMDNHITSHHLMLGPIYQCVYCDQNCSQQRSMRKHLKERHPESEPRFRQTRQPIPFHKGRTTRTGPHSNIYLTRYYSRVYLDANRDWKRQAKEIEATDLSHAHLVDPDLYTIEEVAVDESCIQENLDDSADILDAVPVMSSNMGGSTVSMTETFQPHFETSMTDTGLHQQRLTSSFTGAYSSPLNIDSIESQSGLEPYGGRR